MTRIEGSTPHRHTRRRRLLGVALILALLLLAGVAYWSWRTYQHLSTLRAHLGELKALSPSDINAIGPALVRLQGDVAVLRRDLRVPLGVAPHLGWLPIVGPTIRAGPRLFSAGESLLAASTTVWGVVERPIEGVLGDELSVEESVAVLGEQIEAGETRLNEAAGQVHTASDLISSIDAERLLPRLARPLARIQPLMPLLTAAFDGLPLLPGLVAEPGEQTYLLLAQNSDELRATGGFISSVGALTINQGVPRSLGFQDSYRVEDWNQPHPDPPEPLRKYMKLDLWVTRDANWWPDFPTSAKAVAELYELNQGQQVAGVLAIDVQAAVRLLEVLTPLKLPDGRQLKSGQVNEALHEAWSLPPEKLVTSGVIITATRPYTGVEIALTYSKKSKGRVWFDSVELEDLGRPGVNLAQNPSFEDDLDQDGLPDAWDAVGLADGDGLVADRAHTGEASLYITADPGVHKAVVQRVAVSGAAGTKFRVSAMSQGEGVDYKGGPHALIVTFLYEDGKRQPKRLRFPDLAHEWASAGTTKIQAGWLAHRKDFVDQAAQAAVAKVLSQPSAVPWLDLLGVFKDLLDQRHIQVFVDDVPVQQVFQGYGWAGAMLESDGDYLLVVDSNVGYNKVNASMEQSLRYDVEIEPSGRVCSRLTLSYHNKSTVALTECDKFSQYVPSYAQLTEGCYWDYVRIYVPPGSEVQSATGGDEPVDAFSQLGHTVLATSFVVRPGEERKLEIEYLLPQGVLRDGVYELWVQKQAGTGAIPLRVRVNAAGGLTPRPGSPEASSLSRHQVSYATDLLVDRHIAVEVVP